MAISLTGLVTGANRLIAGRARGRLEGEELRSRREERRESQRQTGEELRSRREDRRLAAERQALQDSLMNQYRQAQIRRLNRPTPAFDANTDPELLREQERHRRGYGSTGQPRAGRSTPEYSSIQISRAMLNVPLTEDNEPIPESQRRALAIQWLDNQRARPRRQPIVVPPLP